MLFSANSGGSNWYKSGSFPLDIQYLCAVDTRLLVESGSNDDTSRLQQVLDKIAYGYIKSSDADHLSFSSVRHIFILAQIIIQYLIYSQGKLLDANEKLNDKLHDAEYKSKISSRFARELEIRVQELLNEVNAQRREISVYSQNTKALCESSNSGKEVFVCPYCPQTYSLQESLELHVDRRHSPQKSSPSPHPPEVQVLQRTPSQIKELYPPVNVVQPPPNIVINTMSSPSKTEDRIMESLQREIEILRAQLREEKEASESFAQLIKCPKESQQQSTPPNFPLPPQIIFMEKPAPQQSPMPYYPVPPFAVQPGVSSIPLGSPPIAPDYAAMAAYSKYKMDQQQHPLPAPSLPTQQTAMVDSCQESVRASKSIPRVSSLCSSSTPLLPKSPTRSHKTKASQKEQEPTTQPSVNSSKKKVMRIAEPLQDSTPTKEHFRVSPSRNRFSVVGRPDDGGMPESSNIQHNPTLSIDRKEDENRLALIERTLKSVKKQVEEVAIVNSQNTLPKVVDSTLSPDDILEKEQKKAVQDLIKVVRHLRSTVKEVDRYKKHETTESSQSIFSDLEVPASKEANAVERHLNESHQDRRYVTAAPLSFYSTSSTSVTNFTDSTINNSYSEDSHLSQTLISSFQSGESSTITSDSKEFSEESQNTSSVSKFTATNSSFYSTSRDSAFSGSETDFSLTSGTSTGTSLHSTRSSDYSRDYSTRTSDSTVRSSETTKNPMQVPQNRFMNPCPFAFCNEGYIQQNQCCPAMCR